ncbi:hypothetical protein DL765_007443 [Monosporascus sp. GIB2]|nr:hypothetical protein DL765_007443 [Monosporascus sp. GIB2]
MPGVIVAGSSTRPHEHNSHLCGRILWLPKKEDTKDASDDLYEGCYHHPVVILSVEPQEGKVDLLVLTSFGEKSLEDKHPRDIKARSGYLPIEPCSPHPDNGRLLTLEDPSLKLRKKSYVNTRELRTVTFNTLQPYQRRNPKLFYVLKRTSYQELIEYAKYTVPPPTIIQLDASPQVPPQAETLAVRASDLGFSAEGVYPHLFPDHHHDTRPPACSTIRRENERSAAAALARLDVSLEHLRGNQPALVRILDEDEDRRSHVPTITVSAQARSSSGRHGRRVGTERQTLLPLHNNGGGRSYGSPSHYYNYDYYYGSTSRPAAPTSRLTGSSLWRRVFCGIGGVFRSCFVLLSRVPWGTVGWVAFTFVMGFRRPYNVLVVDLGSR